MEHTDRNAAVAGAVILKMSERHVSLRSLSKTTGISATTLARRLTEPDTSPFRVDEILLICDALECNAADVIPGRAA